MDGHVAEENAAGRGGADRARSGRRARGAVAGMLLAAAVVACVPPPPPTTTTTTTTTTVAPAELPVTVTRDGLKVTAFSETAPVRVQATGPAVPAGTTYQWFVDSSPMGSAATMSTTLTRPGLSVVRVTMTSPTGATSQAWVLVAVRPTAAQLRAWEAGLLALANTDRGRDGMPALVANPSLGTSARAWSTDMAANGLRGSSFSWADAFRHDLAGETIGVYDAGDVFDQGVGVFHRIWAGGPSAGDTVYCRGCTLAGYGLVSKVSRDGTGHPDGVAVYATGHFIDPR